MQTFLLVSSSQSFIENEIDKKKNALSVPTWNYHEINPSPSIGIEQVRTLQKLLSQKPYGGGKRLMVIRSMHVATVDAQNALLKLLEEPPENTIIILTSSKKDALLPTIISRTHVIASSPKDNPAPNHTDTRAMITKLLRESAGLRLTRTQTIASTKEDALTLLLSMLSALEENVHKKTIPELSMKDTALMMKKIETARSYIERNINYKTTLDILFLGFPKIS